LTAGRHRLSGPVAHHLSRVLRVKPGDRLVLFDGRGREARATVTSVDRQEVGVLVEEPRLVNREPPIPVGLAFALSKGDKPEWIVQKAVELGATTLVVFAATRSVAVWRPEQIAHKLDRLRAVIDGACAQCERTQIPALRFAPDLPAMIEQTAAFALRLVTDPEAPPSLGEALRQTPVASLCLCTGPEGGLTANEYDVLAGHGWQLVNLGPRILRAETAALAALAAVQSWLEAPSP
jgi:16S rRNA (uracil1498-N3)-methyltransferase